MFWCVQRLRQSLSDRTVNWNFALRRSRKHFFSGSLCMHKLLNGKKAKHVLSLRPGSLWKVFSYKSIPTDVHESIMSYLHFMANLRNISHSNFIEKLRSIGLKEFLCLCSCNYVKRRSTVGTIFLSSLEGWVAIQGNDKRVTSPVVARSFMQI